MNCSESRFPFACLLWGGEIKIYCFPGIIITDKEQGEAMDSHHFIAELWTSQGRWEGVHSQLHHPFPPLGHILPAQTLLLGENSSMFWRQEEKVKCMWVQWPGHCQPQQSSSLPAPGEQPSAAAR